MATQSQRSLKVSPQKLNLVKKALLDFDSQAELAAQLGMSRTTVSKFCTGKSVQRSTFHKICKKLKLRWQDIADLPDNDEEDKGYDVNTPYRITDAANFECLTASTYQDSIERDAKIIILTSQGIPKVVRSVY